MLKGFLLSVGIMIAGPAMAQNFNGGYDTYGSGSNAYSDYVYPDRIDELSLDLPSNETQQKFLASICRIHLADTEKLLPVFQEAVRLEEQGNINTINPIMVMFWQNIISDTETRLDDMRSVIGPFMDGQRNSAWDRGAYPQMIHPATGQPMPEAPQEYQDKLNPVLNLLISHAMLAGGEIATSATLSQTVMYQFYASWDTQEGLDRHIGWCFDVLQNILPE